MVYIPNLGLIWTGILSTGDVGGDTWQGIACCWYAAEEAIRLKEAMARLWWILYSVFAGLLQGTADFLY